MKYSFREILNVLLICLALTACEKEPIKDEPKAPTTEPTKPSTPTEPTNPEPAKVTLAAYFPFNGDLKDMSGNDYYGYGAPTPSFADGVAGGKKSLSFSKRGKEAFVVGDGIIDTRSMTVSFWIKDVSEGDIFHLTSSNSNSGSNKMMRLVYRDGHLKYVVSRSNNVNSSFSSTGNFTHKKIDDGEWHHLALVSDYNTITSGVVTTSLYLDGQMVDMITEELSTYNESQETYAHFGTGTKFVLGGENVPSMQIACLRMYNESQLDAKQVQEIYDKEINGVIDSPATTQKPTIPANIKSGLTAYFPFNGDLNDLSGNEYFGYGVPVPSFTEGVTGGKKALSFTKRGKEAFVVGAGIVDTRSMTVSLWIKDISEGDIFHLTSSNSNSGSDKMMRLAYRDGHLKYVVSRSNNVNSSFNSTGNLTHMSIDDGGWHHVVIVSDYNTLKSGSVTTSLYVDGHIMDTVTEELSTYSESQETYAHFGTGTKFVLGGDNAPSMKVACLRMYGESQLDRNQVAEIYDQEISGVIDAPMTTPKPTTPANIKSGLTAYFPFNGDLNDLSGNEYFGYGAPVPSFTEGVTGGKKALSFTKRGKEAFVVGAGIVDTRSMTVSLWIKDISEGDIFHLTSSNSNSGSDKMMRFAYRDGHLKYVVSRSNNVNSSFNSTGNLTHMSIDDGGWHHVVIVSDYNTLKSGSVTTSLYVDGHIMDTVTEELSTYSESQETYAHFGTGTKFVLGGDNAPSMKVACLRMYGESQLDRNQVAEIYNKEINGVIDQPENVKKPSSTANVKTGLTAYFTFNGNFDDISGNDYYGYGSPAPSFTEGIKAGTKALAFTKTGKEAFIVSEGVIDTRSMTVSLWIKDVSEGDIFHLTSSNSNSGSDKMMRLAYRDGHLKYVVSRSNNVNSSFNSTGNLTHMSIDDGGWHHVVIVSDYNTLKSGSVTTSLYVDGHIMDTVTEELSTYSESQETYAHFGTGTKFVLGGENTAKMQVTCLRMYDSRQLNEADVMSLYTDKH